MTRFDYVKYDAEHTAQQEAAKEAANGMAIQIERLPDGRAKSLALNKLEECYMWIGKGIRDDQVARGGASAHVPERTEG